MSNFHIPCAICEDRYGIHEMQKQVAYLEKQMEEFNYSAEYEKVAYLMEQVRQIKASIYKMSRRTVGFEPEVINDRIWMGGYQDDIDPNHQYTPMDNLDYLLWRDARKPGRVK